MDNSEKYNLLAEGETGLASAMGIYPRSKNFKFDAAQIEKSLAQNSDFNLKSFNKVEVDIEYSIMSFHAEIEYKEAIFNVDLYISDT